MLRLLLSLVMAGSFPVTILAQTTWTSFENRKGHTIASSTNGVLMFGGETSSSSGSLLNDTNAFSNTSTMSSWTRLSPTAVPSRRTEHAMAAGVSTDDTAIFILFGGLAEPNGGGGAIPSDETFVYNGGWGSTGIGQTRPSARTGHSMVSDLERNRIVLFGGRAGGLRQNDLWEFDPVNMVWLQPTVTGPLPPDRFDHASAFHPGSGGNDGRVYISGGSPFRDDMWEYDPHTSSWSNVTAVTRPPVRRRGAMAYLSAFDQLVLFGGQDNSLTPLDDTWTWDRNSNTWTLRTPTTSPSVRFDHAMAPDQLDNNLVLLGGEDGTNRALPGTWLWNGVQWVEELPSPSSRAGAAMAYDSNRDRHVAFGGRDASSGVDLDETWEIDGVNWRQPTPLNAPTARADAGVVFDPARNRTILYGGRSGGLCGSVHGDTWEWDGRDWAPLAPATSPPAAGGVQPVFDELRNVIWMLVDSQMYRFDGIDWERQDVIGQRSANGAFDAGRDETVLFGGSAAGVNLDETWAWTRGGTWVRRMPATTPPARRRHAMVYDWVRDEVVLFGGVGAAAALDDTWTWDGSDWTLHSVATHPSARSDTALSWHAATGRILLYGGADTFITFDDTWEWDGAAWTKRNPALHPSPRAFHAMADDFRLGRVVLFGGATSVSGTNVLGDTWEWDGTNWHPGPAGPSPRSAHRLVYHANYRQCVMFGGVDAAMRFDDTWVYDASGWQQIVTGDSPAPRSSELLVYDDNEGVTLLFGGFDALVPTFGARNDTWKWDGADWREVASGTPPDRTNYGAAYDARRDRVVVFGGRTTCSSGPYLADTWEWDGASWLVRRSATSPSPRERSQLAFDESRARVVLFGGTDGTNTTADTWEWDGQQWIPRSPLDAPPGSAGHGLAYDRERRVSVLFGAAGAWNHQTVRPGRIDSFGSGCVGSNGTPTLSTRPWAGGWLGESIEVDLLNQPPGLGLFVWGFSDAFWVGGSLPFSLVPIGSGPGCELLVSDTVTQLILSGTNPYVSFVWPSDPSFLGAVMFGQAGFLDTGLGGAPVVSQGLRVTFGSK